MSTPVSVGLATASCGEGRCRDLPSAKPSVFAPAGDLLSCAHKKVGKEGAPVPSPLAARGVPCASRGPGPRPTRFVHYVHCAQTRGAKSVDEARFARAPAPCDARLLQRGVRKQPNSQNSRNSQQPSPKSGWLWLFLHPPFEPAEERRTLRPRAQRASSSDFAQLFERSVAKRVLREASRSAHRREARSEAKGRADRGRLFAYFLVAQKVGRPPGRKPKVSPKANPGTTLSANPSQQNPRQLRRRGRGRKAPP